MPSPSPHTVLVDANVIYSRTLRDWLALIYLKDAGLIRVRWTTDILVETLKALRVAHPIWCGRKIEAIREKIEDTFADGRVVDFEIDAGFVGNDPGDAHVHSAALACRADILLTCNAKDFIPSSLDPDGLPYEVWHPDDFFVLIDDSAPHVVRAVVEDQVKYFFSRTGEANLPKALKQAGAPLFAERVRCHLLRMGI